MDKKEDSNIVVIFSAEKENSSLKKFAKLVLLIDDKKNNRAKILKCMDKLGAKCVNVARSNSNNDVVKQIETGKYVNCDEQSMLSFCPIMRK